MTEWEASEKRISCRAYQDRRVEASTLQQLRIYIDQLNTQSGLRFRLYTSEEPGKPAIKLAASMFSGPVYAFAALAAGEDPLSSEKLGYYGQQLILYATSLGLGTCWVASTYDKDSINVELRAGEKLWDVIPIGYTPEKMPARQKMIRAVIRKSDRKPEQFLESEIEYRDLPEWVRAGIDAVLKGPSAANKQPVNIRYHDGKVYARIWKETHGLQYNDLGIAKKQFEIGAAHAGMPGHFTWGDGGEYMTE